jgi:phosphatidylinositol alpha-1,6-mannosyltransferase
MRALILSSEFPPGPGGIGNQAHQLALSLHRHGWELPVVSPQDYVTIEQAQAFNTQQPFRIVTVPSGRRHFAAALHRLRVAASLAQSYRPDVLIGTGLSGVAVAAALGALWRLPAIGVAHGSEFGVGPARSGWFKRLAHERTDSGAPASRHGVLSQRLIRLSYGRMTAVVAVSQFTRHVMQQAGICPRRLEVIPNAADHQRFRVLPDSDRQAFRQAAGFNGVPLLLTVGQVSERKGQEVVIRALPEILSRVPGTHYLMIGLPTLQEPLTRLARQLNVQNHVHFLGVVNDLDLVRWLNCADVFVVTSRTTTTGDCEGFGIAVVEAALCGKPAVVSAQSGLVEAIAENLTGLAVPENDELATAKAIVSLLTDSSLRTVMGHAAEIRARHNQTWETCGAQYDALLRTLIGVNYCHAVINHLPHASLLA